MNTSPVNHGTIYDDMTSVAVEEHNIASLSSNAVQSSMSTEVQSKMLWITAIEIIILLSITAYLLWRFSARNTPWWVNIGVFVGWTLGFSGILLLPLDITFTQSNDQESSSTLITFWQVSFWTTTSLAYIVFPLLRGIVTSGSFTCSGKMRASLCQNLLFYLVASVVVGIALVWVWTSGLSLDFFVGIIMALSNIYGLLLLIVLLSYGLIDTPRYLWLLGDHARQLKKLQINVGFHTCICMHKIHM